MKKKLQVFVSSTYEDLKLDRQAAVSAILKAGHIPAGMELFTAGDKSQMDTIRRWIDESDIYMLILGGRYGSVESKTQVSYTELEFDYALEQDKPLFAVVIDEVALETRVREHGIELLERENPKQLQDFRNKVLSNISSFFADDKDIRLCVYESLSDIAASRELKGWVSADEVVNSQSLVEEISVLRLENDALKQRLENAEKKVTQPQDIAVTDDFSELLSVLEATEVKVPDKLSGKSEMTNSLLSIFENEQDDLVTGVSNSYNSSDHEAFLYYNVCPKLQIHGLVLNEKVAGVQWRHFAITQKGSELLAHLAKSSLIKNSI